MHFDKSRDLKDMREEKRLSRIQTGVPEAAKKYVPTEYYYLKSR